MIALNICPDLGERVMLSGERCVIEELFPEVAQAMMDARSSLAWNHDHRFIIRYGAMRRTVREGASLRVVCCFGCVVWMGDERMVREEWWVGVGDEQNDSG